jgi:hypothetical protein
MMMVLCKKVPYQKGVCVCDVMGCVCFEKEKSSFTCWSTISAVVAVVGCLESLTAPL